MTRNYKMWMVLDDKLSCTERCLELFEDHYYYHKTRWQSHESQHSATVTNGLYWK